MVFVQAVPFLVTFAVLLIASYTDIKQRIVKNYLTAGLIVLGLVFHASLSIYTNDWKFALMSVQASVLALVFSMALWKMGVWAAGDVKIFTGIAAMNPVNPDYLSSFFGLTGYVSQLPLFFLEVVMTSVILFLPVSIALITFRIMVEGIKEKIDAFKKMFYLVSIASFYFAVAGSLIPNGNNLPVNLLIGIGVLAVFWLLKKHDEVLILIVVGGFLLADLNSTITAFAYLFFFLLSVGLILFFLLEGRELLNKRKKVSELEEGEIISSMIIERNGRIIVEKPLGLKKTFKYLKELKLRDIMNHLSPKGRIIASYLNARGLTQKELEELKKLAGENKISKHIEIKESLAFIPLVFLAFIVLNITGDWIWQLIGDSLGVLI